MALALETLGSHKALDLGGLGVVRLALTSDGAADDELADIVLLVETEELADVGGTLGTESLGVDDVCEAGDVALTLLDDGKGQDGEVETGDGWEEEIIRSALCGSGRSLGLQVFYLREHSCACAHRSGGGGSSCGRRKGGA